MSNQSSIAAVTAAIRNLLTKVAIPFAGETDTDLTDTQVTTVPPDQAGLTTDHNQINLFLYHVTPSAHARNLDGSGQSGRPPGLALNLQYMMSVYGRGNSDILAHRLLGRAMSLLHSYPILAPADLAAALPGENLDQATDRVRLVQQDATTEEMMRLWAGFQVKYRLSVLYRAATLILDNEVATTMAQAVQSVAIRSSTIMPYLAVPENGGSTSTGGSGSTKQSGSGSSAAGGGTTSS